MTVRLTHRQKPDTQNYIFQALGSPFSLTGIAASLRIAYRMLIPDKIPYVLSGQSATVSKLPPVWGTLSSYSLSSGVSVPAALLPVSVPNGGSPTITVAWHSSSVPSTKPAWVTLTSGSTPTIAFTGAQGDSDDVTSMVLSATANGSSPVLSTGVAITVSGAPALPAFSSDPWRQVQVNASFSPFSGGAKHVYFGYHPGYTRVYTFGGDFGTGATAFSYDGGTGTDTQPNGGMTFTTNKPSGASTYTEGQGAGAGTTSYRNDMYSLNPYETTPPWRLEHPYLPRNLSGSPEDRPPCNCQRSLVWDSSRNKFWCISTHERGASDGSMYGLDPWAIGTTYSPVDEPPGTYSWIPNSVGGAGTFTKETTNALIYQSSGPSTPTYTGSRLYTAWGDERIANWVYDSTQDVCVSMSGDGNGNLGLFIFKPASKTYEWRRIPHTGYSPPYCQSPSVAVLDGWVYGTAYGTLAGNRESWLFRVNLTNALALANGATLTENTSNVEFFKLPFSMSPNRAWELNGGAGIAPYGKISEHNGLFVVEGKIIVAVTYYGIVDATEGTKIAAFAPSNKQFYVSDSCPYTTYAASSWTTLTPTSEILMGLTTTGPNYNSLVAYRPTHLGPLSVENYDSDEGTDIGGVGVVVWQSAFTTNSGTIILWGTGDHDQLSNNAVREYNPTSKSTTSVYPNNNGTIDQQQYDNQLYWYIPAVDSLAIPTRGQYSRASGTWVSGSLQSGGAKVVGTAAGYLMYRDSTADASYLTGGSALYNPHIAWSEENNCGVAIGGTDGTSTGYVPLLHIVVPSTNSINSTAVSQSNPYTIYARSLSGITFSGVTTYGSSGRDGCCFLGDYVYWVGGNDAATGTASKRFFRMKITPHLTSKTVSLTGAAGTGAIEKLTDAPDFIYAGLLRADKYLNALLLVSDKGIFAYDVTYSTWVNLTSQTGWMNEWSGAPGGLTPFYNLGGFVDTHGGVSKRRFFWRPGANNPTASWSTGTPGYNTFRSLKLKRA